MMFKKSALHCAIIGVSLGIVTTTKAVVMQDDSVTLNSSTQSAQTPKLKTRRVIVEYKNELSTVQSSIDVGAMSDSVTATTGVKVSHLRQMGTGAHVFSFDGDMSLKDFDLAMAKLSADPSVASVQEDELLQIMATPNDTAYVDQWHYYEAIGGLNLPDAWDESTGAGVVVAVVDTGITDHSDLNANILPGYDMISSADIANDGGGRDSNPDDTGDATAADECRPGSGASNSSWHGTHVAGTIAATTNNNLGVAGVAFDAKILPIRALGKCGGFTSDIADGIIWAAGGSVPGVPDNPNPAQVINLSLGGSGACNSQSQAAINTAVGRGATVVVAAGNSRQNVSTATPANCQNVVSVAATGRNGGRAGYSNFGDLVDVAAPGGDQVTGRSDGVLSTVNSGTSSPAGESYAFYQGTSMATPHVAGAAALMYALDPGITPAAVESILKSTARSFPNTCSGCGDGIVDAAAAVSEVSDGDPSSGKNLLVNGEPVTGRSGATGSETQFTIDVPAGANNLTFTMSGGSGDADLYVRFGAAPTTTTYDCRPFRNGNFETCTISNVQAGTYHVMLRGYSAFSGVSLQANY